MAKADQEAHRSIGRESARKALPAGHGQSQETYALHDLSADRQDRQAGLSIDTQHNTLDFGPVRDRVEKKRAVDFANVVYYPPQPQPTDAQFLPDEKWLQQVRVSRPAETKVVAVRTTPVLERRPPDVRKGMPIAENRQIQLREDFATRALQVWQERQPQRDMGNKLMQQRANALHVERRTPIGEVWKPPTALALDRAASSLVAGNAMPLETDRETIAGEQTKDRRDKKSDAEDKVLRAIRSKADSDGKNAKVGYENLAAMTGFSRRHVIRVVKSLIFERGLVRVDKRVMRPGRNAINVYQVVSRDGTASEKGTGVKTGKTGQTEITRVTEPVTPAKPLTIPALPHAPVSSAFVTEKPSSTFLTAGRKPRHRTRELLPRELVAA